MLGQKQDVRNVADGILMLKNLRKTALFFFPDVAIGAPQEDDLKGAVYIYNGRRDGISPTPSQVRTGCVFPLFLTPAVPRTNVSPILSSVCLQRITGSTLGRHLKMFGQSLSSGIDVDVNGYPGNSSRHRQHK